MTWVIGVALSVGATLSGSLGKVFMKLSHDSGQDMRILMVGFAFVLILNPVLDCLSYGFAAQSMLAPMAGLSVVWNALLSPHLLGEALTKYDVVGTTVVAMGCVLVGITATHNTPTHSMQMLFDLFHERRFCIYIEIVGLICAWLFWLVYSRPLKSETRQLAFGAVAGIVGGNFFFTKSFVELAGKGLEVWTHYETYGIALGALASAGGGLIILNAALKHYEALYIVSVYQSFLILTGSVSGMIFFDEFQSMGVVQESLYCAGLAVTIAGVIMLSGGRHPVDHETSPLLSTQVKPVQLLGGDVSIPDSTIGSRSKMDYVV